MIAITNTIPSNAINKSAPPEVCVVELALSSPLLISCVYLSPSCDTSRSTEVFKFLQSLYTYRQLIIVGDFNLPDINWNSLSASSPLSPSFCDTVLSLNLVQLIDEATHSCGNSLDLVLTTIPSSIHNLCVDHLTCSSVSDHHLVTFDVVLPFTRKPPKSYLTFDYSRADFNELENFFFDNSFKDCLPHREVNSVWSSFKSVFFNGCSIFIPTIKKHPKSTPLWFNSKIRHRIKCIRTLKRRLA